MAKVRSNGRIVNFQGRREYRIRKRAGRIQRRNANGKLLKKVMQELWNRKRKQDNRWLRSKVESKDRGGIPFPIEQELVQWFRAASKREQEKPKLRPDFNLSTEAMQIWQSLKAERKAAMAAQGQKFEAEDWWLEEKGGEEGKGKMTKARTVIGETAATMEGLGVEGEEYVVEDEDGNFVFLSPEGSVAGGDGEIEGEEAEGEGGVGGSLALPIRELGESSRS